MKIAWLFQNDDEPNCPADLYIGKPEWYRQLRWRLRNFMHNFTWYVIGFAHKPREVIGMYPRDVFNPNGGWKWHRVYKIEITDGVRKRVSIGYPFVSYYGERIMAYIGWRERGNFGIKFRGVP